MTAISRCDLVGHVAHGGGEGGVAVPAVDDRAAVDRDDVAVGEHDVVGRHAVHDHGVGRGADHRRERRVAVAQEVGGGAPAGQDLTADAVELAGGDPGLDGGADLAVHLGDDATGAPHDGDLLGGADRGRAGEQHDGSQAPRRDSTAASSRANTSSVVPEPVDLGQQAPLGVERARAAWSRRRRGRGACGRRLRCRRRAGRPRRRRRRRASRSWAGRRRSRCGRRSCRRRRFVMRWRTTSSGTSRLMTRSSGRLSVIDLERLALRARSAGSRRGCSRAWWCRSRSAARRRRRP